jgi:superkiller protein 3
MRIVFLLGVYLLGISFSSKSQEPTALYQDGVRFKEQKKITEAVDKFTQAIQLQPGYTEALYELGWCRNDLKDYKGALEALRQTLPAWNNIPKVFFEMGYALEKTGFTDSAIISYNKCLSIKPDYSLAFKQLGYIYYQKSEMNSAVENFAKYEANAKSPITDYLFWYRKGFCLNALKKYTEAKPALQKSLEFKSDYANTLLELGFACSRSIEEDQAIVYYNKAIELDPKSHIGYNGIAEVYRDYKKDITLAMVWYQKTLSMNAGERKANFGMGYCLNSNSKFSDAVPYLKKAIEKEDTYTAAYVELGYSYYKLANYTDAMSNLDRALYLNPQNETSRYYKTLIYISQSDRVNAQKMVEELRTLNSKHTATLQEQVNKM